MAPRQASVTFEKSPSAKSAGLTIQVPPQATMHGELRYSSTFAVLTPPVGMKRWPTNGAHRALMVLRPPYCAAGKNLVTVRPSLRAAVTSEGVTVPGSTGTSSSMQRLTTSASKPGLTMKPAPAATASSTCSTVRTVPAPTLISGTSSCMALMHSAAQAVRKVTSAEGMPPATSARAMGTASSTLSRTTTGTMARSWSFW